MRTSVIAALAVLALSVPIAAQPPPFSNSSLKALWAGASAAVPQPPTCTRFVMVDTGVTFQVALLNVFPPGSPPVIVVAQGGSATLAGPFVSAAEAEDWLVQLFIRING